MTDFGKTFNRVKTSFVDLFDEASPLSLECGESLSKVRVAYQTYGKLNDEGTNAVVICHALTGNAHAAGILESIEYDSNSQPDCLEQYSIMAKDKPGWWNELIGPDKLFNTNKYFVISSNILGSCYGTTGPTSLNPGNLKKYGYDFPIITVRDMVHVQKKLIDHLGVNKIRTVAGGSLGGMQVLEWPLLYPELVESIIPIATSAQHSPWAIGLNEASRNAIINDPEWQNGNYDKQPLQGLSLARKIAMISYRSHGSFERKFSRKPKQEKSIFTKQNYFDVEGYLDYQGEKLTKRFDANTYLTLSKVMDLHDITRHRGSFEEVLGSIQCPSLNIGITSDILYPAEEQKQISSLIPNSQYAEVNSIHGHDAFLIEFEQLTNIIGEFLKKVEPVKKSRAV